MREVGGIIRFEQREESGRQLKAVVKAYTAMARQSIQPLLKMLMYPNGPFHRGLRAQRSVWPVTHQLLNPSLAIVSLW